MGPFRRTEVTGVDIGSTSVKAVRLGHGAGTPQLLGAAIVDLDAIGSDASSYTPSEPWELTTEAVRRALSLVGADLCGSGRIVSAVGGPRVSVKVVPFPKMPEHELSRSLRFEAKRHLAFDAETAVLSSQVMGGGAKPKNRESGEMLVILAAAEDRVVKEHLSLLEMVGVQPDIVDLVPLALMNEADEEGLVNGRAIAVIELGRVAANLSVYSRGGAFLARSIQLPERAGGTGEGADEPPDGRNGLRKRRDEAMDPGWLGAVLKEVRFSLAFYDRENGKDGIEAVYLAGGNALTEGTLSGFRDALGLPVEVMRPLDHVGPGTMDVSSISSQTPRLALAVGLARRRQ